MLLALAHDKHCYAQKPLVQQLEELTMLERAAAAKPVEFSKVELLSPRASQADFRLSLPGGAVLEWSGAELPPAVVDLVERLTSPR